LSKFSAIDQDCHVVLSPARICQRCRFLLAKRSLIEVEQLARRFGETIAVGGISFCVQRGEIFGFLGPNGAGKSTTIKMLCTLLRPTSGVARVSGYDVARDPHRVRQSLGLLFQDQALDDRLTGRENLALHCMIYGVPRSERSRRIEEGLAWMDLLGPADDRVRTFSGGMRRRLEVARALLHRPSVLFLDEPTTGLDPQTRRSLWAKLIELRDREKITIFMSTHYMEEAEHCDRLAIIDHGLLVAEGTPAELRTRAGTERIALSTVDDERAALAIKERLGVDAQRTERGVEFPVESGEKALPALFGFPVEIRSLAVRKPTLEDAFIALTGHAIRAEEASARDVMRRAARMRGRAR
jgi:ABC-2 type transport system ATP-binding protein